MNYEQFEALLSRPRLQRYLDAVQDKEKALLLYAYNIQLSQQLFAVISMFEVILRNKINQCIQKHSNINNWLHQAVQKGGMFDTQSCKSSKDCIDEAISKLIKRNEDSRLHDKLLAELNFGFWRYLFWIWFLYLERIYLVIFDFLHGCLAHFYYHFHHHYFHFYFGYSHF